MTANQETCQKCGSPVTPGMKFCESCGAKIEPLPACPQCGAPLVPEVKFCESCGAPVSPVAAPVKEAMVKEAPAEAAPAVAAPAEPAPAAAPVPPVKAEEKPVPEPEKKPEPAPAPVTVQPPPEKAKQAATETGPKKPLSRQTMIIAGVVVLALLGAAVYFVVLPMLSSGSGTPAQNPQGLPVLPVPTAAHSSPVPPATTAGTGQAGTVSLVTGPTQVPPSNRIVILDAERDPISSVVTVTFKGGAGQYGVREIAVTLTRSDGSQESKTFKPNAIGDGVTIQGTQKTDRVEATTYFYTGEQYKILDQIFEYKKRGG